MSATTAEVAADRPLAFHVDGEVYAGGPRLRIRVAPASLRVHVPAAMKPAPWNGAGSDYRR